MRLYADNPSVHPVHPKEFGADPKDPPDTNAPGSPVSALISDDNSSTITAPPPGVETVPATAPAVPAAISKPEGVAVTGKGPAGFHMKPSKEPKKLELGEAYLQAQAEKSRIFALTQKNKQQLDFVQALVLAGKTPEEITGFLALLA
jgi:hypothetical protein